MQGGHQPVDLEEAHDVLSGLAAAFFSVDGIEHAIAEFLKNKPSTQPAERPDSATRYKALVEQIPAVIFIAPMDQGAGEAWSVPRSRARWVSRRRNG